MARPTSILAAVTLAAAIAAGGSAFTASNTGQAVNQTVGYGTTNVSGATVNSLVYNTSANGSTVTSVTLKLANDTTSSSVKLGFNGNAPKSCGTGTFASLETTYECTDAAVFPQTTGTLISTDILVSSSNATLNP